jgi:hypothetical protein
VGALLSHELEQVLVVLRGGIEVREHLEELLVVEDALTFWR